MAMTRLSLLFLYLHTLFTVCNSLSILFLYAPDDAIRCNLHRVQRFVGRELLQTNSLYFWAVLSLSLGLL
jgi:hypothetical protein